MIKSDIPFHKLYSCVSPEGFILLFKGEIPQTMAFILSFCPRKCFVRKVIRLFEKKEKDDSSLKKTSHTIREYLSRCERKFHDNDLVSIVEEQISIMTDGYKSKGIN